ADREDQMSQALSLIDTIRHSEEKIQKILHGTTVMFAVFTVFYLLLLVVNPDPDLPLYARIMGGCYVAAFGSFLFLLREQIYRSRSLDYSQPLPEFLTAYLPRLKFFNPLMIAVIPMLLLIDIGVTLTLLNNYWPDFEPTWLKVLSIQIPYWGIMASFLLFAQARWRRTKKPFADQIKEMLSDLQED
ncbi:MAG TPA: hypothetical protein PKN24_16930, partial [bacterium]|nr:hypothetical protein [bacterium]